MESFNFISKLLDGRVVLGAKEEVGENLFIIPVYKVKISFLNLKTDIKSTNGDGASGNLSVTPICLLKIYNSTVEILSLEEVSMKDGFSELIPNVLSNLDVNTLLKGFKLNG